MTQPELSVEQAKQQVRDAQPWIEPLGRLGYAAKGVVYAVVGVLAAQAALGAGGTTTDTRGALGRIVQAPFGQVLLGIVAVGLAGFALWSFVQFALDTENKGRDAKGWARRSVYALIGIVYVGLALSAVRILRGVGADGNMQQSWTARLMTVPFGRVLVGLIGVGVIVAGLFQLYRAFSAKFRDELKLHQMSATEQQWAIRSGRFGFAARGVVFALIGSFLIGAARRANAGEARGLGGALQTLAEQPYGPWLLGAVAFGLIAYALYCLIEARYRRMIIR